MLFPAKIDMYYTREATKGAIIPPKRHGDIPHSTYIGIIREMLNKGNHKLKGKNELGDIPCQHIYVLYQRS